MLPIVLAGLAGAAVFLAGAWIGRRYALPLVVDVRQVDVQPVDDAGGDPAGVTVLSDAELAEDEADDDQADERDPLPGRPYGTEEE